MTKRKAVSDNEELESCPLCSSGLQQSTEPNIAWIACDACRTWYHATCLKLAPQSVVVYFCEQCHTLGHGTTALREERPKRAKVGVDYTALDAGEHVNSLRHSYTGLIETHRFSKSLAQELDASSLTKKYLETHGFTEPIIVHDASGLDMVMPANLTVDEVARLVGEDVPIEVMDVPTQGEDKGWTLGRWAAYYNEPSPTRVRNVISLEVTDTELGQQIKRPRVVRDLDIVTCYWPCRTHPTLKAPKVQAYCLMSLQNSYTDFHVDFAGTSVYYHILQGSKTFLFIPPTTTNLNKYSDWCKSSNQGKIFLADQCKDTFKVELVEGDTMFIPSGWIHAVHTPKKSLVIGGNFLHLYGMQKHLEIADIEELTKVPGKFRFPHFTKTLWFTAFGILASRENLNKHQIMGVYKMAQLLYSNAVSKDPKLARKSSEGVPYDRLIGSPVMVARLLLDYVKYYATKFDIILPGLQTEYELADDEKKGQVLLLKTDLAMKAYEKLISGLTPPETARVVTPDGTFVECWLEVSLSPGDSNKVHTAPTSSRRNYQDPESDESTSHLQPAGQKATPDVQVDASESTQETSVPAQQSPKSEQPEQQAAIQSAENTNHNYTFDNSYLPPLMSFSSVPTSPPRLHANGSQPSSEGPKGATTCFRCKTRKRKCDKERPCKSCTEMGLAASCSDSGLYVSMPMATLSPTSNQQESPINTMNESTRNPVSPLHNVQGDIGHGEPKAKRSRKLGSRCSRCARDKKQCSKEEPICDRCIKKELKPSDCVYPNNPRYNDQLDLDATQSPTETEPSRKPDVGNFEANFASPQPQDTIMTNGNAPHESSPVSKQIKATSAPIQSLTPTSEKIQHIDPEVRRFPEIKAGTEP